MSVYVVVCSSDVGNDPDGGGLIPQAFATFEEAKKAGLARFPDELQSEKDYIEESGEGESVEDTKESDTGLTHIYIEKGINIYIHKLKLPAAAAGRRRKTRKSRKSRK